MPVIDDDEVYCDRVAGMDISKRDVKVAVRLVENGRVKRLKVRTFRTTTRSLLVLRDWLEELDVTLVAMESTGVYWKPLFLVLEDRFECWLLNPRDVKRVPGRKSDLLTELPGPGSAASRRPAGELARFRAHGQRRRCARAGAVGFGGAAVRVAAGNG